MNNDNPLKAGMNRLMSYAFTLLAVAFMLTWAWDLLRPLVPVIVVAVAVVLTVAAAARHFVNRRGHW